MYENSFITDYKLIINFVTKKKLIINFKKNLL